MDSDDVVVPKATIVKYTKEAIPSYKIGANTADILVNCCVEFIKLVSSEANHLSGQVGKCTISPEHVLKALEELGFETYLETLEQTQIKFKETQKATPKLGGKTLQGDSSMTEEEQIQLQKKMFDDARRQSMLPNTFGMDGQ